MGKVFRFPCPELTIYLPLNSLPDDEFEAITISDDSLCRGTIYKGDIVVVKVGFVQSTGLHAFQTPTGLYVGFLVEKENDLVIIECNNDEYEPETYRRDEVQILGRVVQVYPGGDIRYRWELICEPEVTGKIARAN